MKILTVQIYTNRVDADLTPYLTYAYQYNYRHGIELHFDIQRVDVNGYKSVQVPMAGGGYGYVLEGADSLVKTSLNHDITLFLFDFEEWKTPWYSFYPIRADAPRSSCFLNVGRPFINLAFYAKTAQDIENTKVTFIHELMHAYCKIAGVGDQMDSYYKNYDPDAPDGNFAVQWRILKDWLNPVAKTQQSTIDLVAGFEGFSAKPYRDIAGNWTIGYGFTTYDGVPVTSKTKLISQLDAKVQLMKQIQVYANAVVSDVVKTKLTQNQFDACVSLCYNIGTKAFASSSVVRLINQGKMKEAADAFLLWNRAGGRVIQGLKNRRQKERTVFLS